MSWPILLRSMKTTPSSYLRTGLRITPNAPFWAEASFNREYSTFPLTAECWVRVFSTGQTNIILSNGYRTAIGYFILANHWEIKTEKDTGQLVIHLQNADPSNLETGRVIADGDWHYIVLVYQMNNAAVYLDGEKVAEQALASLISTHPLGEWSNEGPLFFGSYPPDGFGCDGEIGAVRISHAAREIQGSPEGPFLVDYATIGCWNFDGSGPEYPDMAKTSNPVRVIEYLPTLDENDRHAFGVETSPFQRTMQLVDFTVGAADPAVEFAQEGLKQILLHGDWQYIFAEPHGLSEARMLQDESAWTDAFTAQTPASVQTALFENGQIDDPMIEMNNLNISWAADKEWWMRKTFTVPADWRAQRIEIRFEGVDYRATFWLNGYRLGQHEGMFGGPAYDVSDLLYTGENENVLVLCLDPAPLNFEDTFKNNVAYGWHYTKLITLGIWRPVRLIRRGETKLQDPFLRTVRLANHGADVELAINLWHWGKQTQQTELHMSLMPKNFSGTGYRFHQTIIVQPGENRFGFAGHLKNVKPWWPIDMGDPNLYTLSCEIQQGGQAIDHYQANWGARTIEMLPNSDGPNPHRYNFQMCVNGQPLWIKGANWCYVDALLRLDRRRQDRFIQLAKNAHVQLLRVWGGGPVENDEFYDLCDEQGMLVQQEFSMLGFHRLQNVPSLHATDMTSYMVPRLRNRPSLAIWSGANEISGLGRIVEVLGRRCLELDGTRPFRRSCPYGGDSHWYGVYWGSQPLLDYRKVADGRIGSWSPEASSQQGNGPIAFTEFGLSSPPNHETWQRLIPESEWTTWPPRRDSVFLHHTPTWEYVHVDLMNRYASEFLVPDSFPALIRGMQLSQGLGLKILIESMRARKPQTTATFFYKLTENYPACSWATIDYYGVPKRSHYDVQEAYQPVHTFALYDQWNTSQGSLPVTIYAVNDKVVPVNATLRVVALDGRFHSLQQQSLNVEIPTDRALLVCEIDLATPHEVEKPVFLVLDLLDSGQQRIDRNWYFFDFANDPGCLFRRQETKLHVSLQEDQGRICVNVQNTGSVPAISVEVNLGAASNTWYAGQCGLWLEEGEIACIELHKADAVDGENRELQTFSVSAWNAPAVLVER